jgi:simple sugar transport system ATP-binding protein
MLEVRNLSKRYGGHEVFSSVSFTLQKGTITALCGDNGAGKSTLVRCIVGSELPDSGEVVLNRELLPPGDTETSRSRGIEMMYQDLRLCPQHTPVENIFLGRELTRFGVALDSRAMQARAATLFGEIGLSAIPLHRPVSMLSGGQRQAVAIARTLIANPQVLIMDEPTAALGQRESKLIVSLITTLREKGLTILMISHRKEEIEQLAQGVLTIAQGEVSYHEFAATCVGDPRILRS